jgi:hypothetical protein
MMFVGLSLSPLSGVHTMNVTSAYHVYTQNEVPFYPNEYRRANSGWSPIVRGIPHSMDCTGNSEWSSNIKRRFIFKVEQPDCHENGAPM